MPLTLGFMQVGLDIVTSAICKSQLQFQQTNNYQLLYITSSTYFQSAAVMGWTLRNTSTAASLSVACKHIDTPYSIEVTNVDRTRSE